MCKKENQNAKNKTSDLDEKKFNTTQKQKPKWFNRASRKKVYESQEELSSASRNKQKQAYKSKCFMSAIKNKQNIKNFEAEQ